MKQSVIPAPLRTLPWTALLLTCAIGGFGIIVLYSAAGASMTPWALNQTIRFVTFLGMALALSRVPLRAWETSAFPLYGLFLVLLFAVEMLGAVRGGSQRWLDLGFIRLQPSELMKVAIVLAMARFYSLLPASQTRTFTAIWPAAVLIGLPAALVMLQPDLGTALMITGGGLTITFLAGLPLRLYVGAGLAVAAAAPIVFSLMHEYQRNRVLIFLDPESDPLGKGYHISQSKIAIGSGGLGGKGWLQGTQSRLQYLPERQTDFVFATMAEEWGLAGGLFLIFAFFLLIRWAMQVAHNGRTKFSRLTAAGLATTIFFYVAINLMMVMGLAPVVGIPLPLVSYGGSAIMTVMICLGILMAIDRDNKRAARKL
jgi:rod shape determining protein RodA